MPEQAFAVVAPGLLRPYRKAPHFIEHIRHAAPVGMDADLSNGHIAAVFDFERAPVGRFSVGHILCIAPPEIAFPHAQHLFVLAAEDVLVAALHAAVDAGEVEQIGHGIVAEIAADVVPHGMAGEARVVNGETFEAGEVVA